MLKRISSSYDYNKNPQGVSSFFEIKMDKRTRRFLEAIRNLRKPKILEIGMGQGRFLKKITEFRPDAKLFGIDISRTAIKFAKNDPNLKGNFLIANAEKIPFPDDSFNVVVIMDVLEHVNNPKKVIPEVNRVLKPNGIFHFYVPCENQPFTLDWCLRRLGIMKNFTKTSFGHVQYFSHNDIKKITSRYMNPNFTYSDHLFAQLIYFLTLYIPKFLLSKLGEDKQLLYRDSNIKEGSTKLKLANVIWHTLVVLPTSLLSELEACLFSRLAFTAKGLHFTGRKSK
jgi:ubiquinone/menaquinone biosynthesis C-methylase UbiE